MWRNINCSWIWSNIQIMCTHIRLKKQWIIMHFMLYDTIWTPIITEENALVMAGRWMQEHIMRRLKINWIKINFIGYIKSSKAWNLVILVGYLNMCWLEGFQEQPELKYYPNPKPDIANYKKVIQWLDCFLLHHFYSHYLLSTQNLAHETMNSKSIEYFQHQ